MRVSHHFLNIVEAKDLRTVPWQRGCYPDDLHQRSWYITGIPVKPLTAVEFHLCTGKFGLPEANKLGQEAE